MVRAACNPSLLELTSDCTICVLATGAKQQVDNGDVTGEKPMWASTGGLDFDGRERWEAWNKLKVRAQAAGCQVSRLPATHCCRAHWQGFSKADAQKAFCEAYGRAQSRQDENFRKY